MDETRFEITEMIDREEIEEDKSEEIIKFLDLLKSEENFKPNKGRWSDQFKENLNKSDINFLTLGWEIKDLRDNLVYLTKKIHKL